MGQAETRPQPWPGLSGRLAAAGIAVVAFASLVAQTYVFSILLGERGTLGLTLWVVAGYFTLITNLIVAYVFATIARGRWPARWPSRGALIGCLALSLALVGVVYYTLLSHLWNPVGLHWWADLGLHSVVPLAVMLFWLMLVPKEGLALRHAFYWLGYPAAYFVYIMSRAAFDGWYPYPFLDAATLGYARVLAHALAIGLGFVLAGLALIFAVRQRP